MQLQKNNPIAGISWFVLHCLIFAFISVITKILMKQGMHVFEIVFFQTLIGSAILLPRIIISHLNEIGELSYKIQISRSVLWVAATILFFYSTKYIPVGRAIAITCTVPLFTSILAMIFLKEKPHLRRIIALIIGFIGMLIVIKPGFESFEAASLLVIAASFMWSMTDIMIKIVGKIHHPFVNTFYFTVFCAISTLPIVLLVWQTPTSVQLLWLTLLAVLFVANMLSITKAYECCDLSIVMPFVFTEIIFVTALAYLIFGEVIKFSTAVGSIIIIVSSTYIAYRERLKRGHTSDIDLAEELAAKVGESSKSKT